MTTKELDALQALCDGATAGPWGSDTECARVYQDIGDGLILAIEIESIADCDFIAASRTAMPELIAEVRRLQERCEAAERDRKAALFGEIGSPCNVCAKYGMAQCLLYCDFEWRGPQEDKPDATKEASHENE